MPLTPEQWMKMDNHMDLEDMQELLKIVLAFNILCMLAPISNVVEGVGQLPFLPVLMKSLISQHTTLIVMEINKVLKLRFGVTELRRYINAMKVIVNLSKLKSVIFLTSIVVLISDSKILHLLSIIRKKTKLR